MPPQNEEHNEMLRLLRENVELNKQNHQLLRKLYRHDMIGFTVKILWFAIIIGLPLAAYHYFLAPYFSAIGSDVETFQGMRWIEDLFKTFAG